MLAVHWAPVSKVKNILRKGITKSSNGLYCFPLTGHASVDRWWINFFNKYRVRERKPYIGIVFRILQEDLPGYFGHWIGATTKDEYEKEITNLKELEQSFRQTIEWRLGEAFCWKRGIKHPSDRTELDRLYKQLVTEEVMTNPSAISDALGDVGLMGYTFEDYQIVLSNSIPASRIIKLLPQSREFGRTIHKRKKQAVPRKNQDEE